MSQQDCSPPVRAQDKGLIDRIGHLTRALHESMRELGLDKEVEQAARAIPDARDRLAYIAETTEAAAERALAAIEVARPIQADLVHDAQTLSSRWEQRDEAITDSALAQALTADTQHYLRELPDRMKTIDDQLHEIMMAQDFQDLTGQVVGKLVGVIRRIESQLVEVLVEHMPDGAEHHERYEANEDGEDSLLNGPQINPRSKNDVVTDQKQVDDLLDELGF